MDREGGFSLIEMMIVVAIIGVLTSILIPVYSNYQKKTSIKACLFEVKRYSNLVYVDIFDQNELTAPFSPTVNACESITDASTMDQDNIQKITGVVKRYSDVKIECDLEKGSKCIIVE
ncbi:Fimbrial protein precursor [Acinetobacter venetianus]|uniref:Fimbrial protein n=1 Tax=Acinetobacter venetianus TaxID=52133 RepID=A0A150HPU4_9GAMM|nr:prepilin-type N-terminal cleavage/methylation domain-containing protein [Acinetobacter venetianus]KXZ68631.1 Fimbrial protein precursor [Acinetobacter venetianus]